jgi:hypothetical protein
VTVEDPSRGRKVALLLGSAGESHWSLAAELIASPEGEWLVLDFACRADQSPGFLGCRYRLGPTVRWEAETSLLAVPLGSARLRADAHTAIVQSAPSPNQLDIIPRLVSQRAPTTVRWKYSVEVLAAMDRAAA